MTTPTFIAIVDFATSAADRPSAIAQLERERPAVNAIAAFAPSAAARPPAIAQLERERPAVNAMPGCIACRVPPSRDDETSITLIHEWLDQASFDGYLASDEFARSGEILRPMMVGA